MFCCYDKILTNSGFILADKLQSIVGGIHDKFSWQESACGIWRRDQERILLTCLLPDSSVQLLFLYNQALSWAALSTVDQALPHQLSKKVPHRHASLREAIPKLSLPFPRCLQFVNLTKSNQHSQYKELFSNHMLQKPNDSPGDKQILYNF